MLGSEVPMQNLESTVRNLERRIADLEREAQNFQWRTRSELDSHKSNLELLVFALVNVALIATLWLKR